ncbi:flagellar hook-length control protein FliK [Halalkalibacter nanhaiisediminis]|uniref:Flagellar hook-length control protein FliK n=2 Tax=Halalkalibacter nanhaiisediminis TaxID=688079 RepID=A0A562QEI1_9BACI|nr:flagellar hook-length control protein FliK [Halalkalibacter nanhaiisediminis]
MQMISVINATPTTTSSNRSAANNGLVHSVNSPFAQLLGGLIGGQNNESASTQVENSQILPLLADLQSNQDVEMELILQGSEGEASSLSILLAQMEEMGIVFNEEMMESSEGTRLLEMLPVNWQQDLLELVSTESENSSDMMADWSELQQVLAILLATTQQNQQGISLPLAEREKFMNQLQQLVVRMFPNMSHSALDQQASDIFEDVTQYIKSRLQANPNAQTNDQAFTNLLTNKASTSLPLPNIFASGALSEGPTQGLNISQTGQELGQNMSRVEQAAIHIGDKLPKEVQQQQFLKQFQMILQRGALTQNQQGMSSLSIKLYPEHLGRLDIQLTQVEGAIIARILTGSASTRELMEAQLSQLRQAFAQQQIQVDRIEITQQQQQYVGDENNRQSSQQDTNDQKEQRDETEQEEVTLFQDVLNELTFNEQV